MSSLGVAGHKAMPSAQGPAPSAQGPIASAQDVGCGDVCGPVAKKHCGLLDLFKPRPKCYEYEWVLKKKRVHHGRRGGLCGGGDLCGDTYPSAQHPSPQGGPWAAPQGGYAGHYGSGQIIGSGQMAPAGQIGSGQMAPAGSPAPAPSAADPAAEPPTLPDDTPQASNAGGLLLLSPTGN
jgi:hypothetical protein